MGAEAVGGAGGGVEALVPGMATLPVGGEGGGELPQRIGARAGVEDQRGGVPSRGGDEALVRDQQALVVVLGHAP